MKHMTVSLIVMLLMNSSNLGVHHGDVVLSVDDLSDVHDLVRQHLPHLFLPDPAIALVAEGH